MNQLSLFRRSGFSLRTLFTLGAVLLPAVVAQAEPTLNFSRRPNAHQNTISAVAFDPDGNILFTGSADGVVRAWRGFSLANQWQAGEDQPGGKPGTDKKPPVIRALACGRNKRLAYGTEDGSLYLSDGLTRPWTLGARRSTAVLGAAFSPDGELLAVAAGDETRGTVELWNIRMAEGSESYRRASPTGVTYGQKQAEFRRRVRGVAFSPAGDFLVAWSDDWREPCTLYRVEPAVGGSGYRLVYERGLPHRGPVYAAAFQRDKARLATATLNGEVRLWDLQNSAAPYQDLVPNSKRSPVRCMAFGSGGMLVAGCEDRAIVSWDTSDVSRAPSELRSVHQKEVYGLAYDPIHRRFATGSRDLAFAYLSEPAQYASQSASSTGIQIQLDRAPLYRNGSQYRISEADPGMPHTLTVLESQRVLAEITLPAIPKSAYSTRLDGKRVEFADVPPTLNLKLTPKPQVLEVVGPRGTLGKFNLKLPEEITITTPLNLTDSGPGERKVVLTGPDGMRISLTVRLPSVLSAALRGSPAPLLPSARRNSHVE